MCDLRDIKMWLTGQYHQMIIQSDIKALNVQVILRPIQKWLKQHIICKLTFINEEIFYKKCGVIDKMLLKATLLIRSMPERLLDSIWDAFAFSIRIKL